MLIFLRDLMAGLGGALCHVCLLVAASVLMPEVHAAGGKGAAASAEQEAQTAYEQAMQAWREEAWARAELYLERALMFMPEHAEARVQLALLLAQRGRLQAARALIESLIADPRTPPEHRQQLQQLLAGNVAAQHQSDGPSPVPSAAPAARRAAQSWAEISLAYVRNPFLRTSLGQLDLTLPDGDVTLPLLQNVQPAWVTGVGVGYLATSSQHPWGVELQSQNVLGEEAQGAQRAHLHLGGFSAMLDASYRWSLTAQRTYDGVERQAVALSGLYPTWQWSTGLFIEPTLERRGQTLRVDGELARGDAIRWQGYAESETADSGRPGHGAAGLLGLWGIAPGWVVQLQARFQQDWSGYSSWLDNGARRRMTSWQALVEHRQQLGGNQQLIWRFHRGVRESNLALFGHEDAGLQVTWNAVWR